MAADRDSSGGGNRKPRHQAALTLAAAFAVLGTSVGVDVESALARETSEPGKTQEKALRDAKSAPAVQVKVNDQVAPAPTLQNKGRIDPTAAAQGKIEVPSKSLPAAQHKVGRLRPSPDDGRAKPERH